MSDRMPSLTLSAPKLWRMPSSWSEIDLDLGLVRDLLDTIPRARCKELARDKVGYFAAQECLVEAVISTSYRELWGDKSWKGMEYNAPP